MMYDRYVDLRPLRVPSEPPPGLGITETGLNDDFPDGRPSDGIIDRLLTFILSRLHPEQPWTREEAERRWRARFEESESRSNGR